MADSPVIAVDASDEGVVTVIFLALFKNNLYAAFIVKKSEIMYVEFT